MKNISPDQARRYVDSLQLPERMVSRGVKDLGIVELNFEQIKDQAAVVGSDIVSFVKGVTRRGVKTSSIVRCWPNWLRKSRSAILPGYMIGIMPISMC